MSEMIQRLREAHGRDLKAAIEGGYDSDPIFRDAADELEQVMRERDELAAKYKAGSEQWDPVYKLVLDERDRLRSRMDRTAREALPCKCGAAKCGDLTVKHTYHYFDRCAEMTVFDDIGEL